MAGNHQRASNILHRLWETIHLHLFRSMYCTYLRLICLMSMVSTDSPNFQTPFLILGAHVLYENWSIHFRKKYGEICFQIIVFAILPCLFNESLYCNPVEKNSNFRVFNTSWAGKVYYYMSNDASPTIKACIVDTVQRVDRSSEIREYRPKPTKTINIWPLLLAKHL